MTIVYIIKSKYYKHKLLNQFQVTYNRFTKANIKLKSEFTTTEMVFGQRELVMYSKD